MFESIIAEAQTIVNAAGAALMPIAERYYANPEDAAIVAEYRAAQDAYYAAIDNAAAIRYAFEGE